MGTSRVAEGGPRSTSEGRPDRAGQGAADEGAAAGRQQGRFDAGAAATERVHQCFVTLPACDQEQGRSEVLAKRGSPGLAAPTASVQKLPRYRGSLRRDRQRAGPGPAGPPWRPCRTGSADGVCEGALHLGADGVAAVQAGGAGGDRHGEWLAGPEHLLPVCGPQQAHKLVEDFAFPSAILSRMRSGVRSRWASCPWSQRG